MQQLHQSYQHKRHHLGFLFPDDEGVRLRELVAVVLPIESVLRGVRQAKRVRCGEQVLGQAEQIRRTAILKDSLSYQSVVRHSTNKAAKEFSAAERKKVLEPAADPVRLAVVHRCACQLEDAIDGRMKKLERA